MTVATVPERRFGPWRAFFAAVLLQPLLMGLVMQMYRVVDGFQSFTPEFAVALFRSLALFPIVGLYMTAYTCFAAWIALALLAAGVLACCGRFPPWAILLSVPICSILAYWQTEFMAAWIAIYENLTDDPPGSSTFEADAFTVRVSIHYLLAQIGTWLVLRWMVIRKTRRIPVEVFD